MSLMLKPAMDAELPRAYSIEEEVEAICHYTTGASRGTIEVSLNEGDRSIDKARRAVSEVARKHGATIVNERKMGDSVSFKLSKPIAMDADEIKGEKFVVGGVYLDYPNREWMGKVISRTPSSIRVVTKTRKDRAYRMDEATTVRIHPSASREWGCEVAIQGGGGWDGWEFHADDKV